MNKTFKIAFSGPSGLGKTTLCKEVQRGLKIPHLSTSAGDILSLKTKADLYTRFGYSGAGHRAVINLSSQDPHFGWAFQKAVLDARIGQIINSETFVIDRCPIDNVVYLLSQVGHNLTEYEIGTFIEQAQKAYVELSHVILIKYSPDIPAIEDNQSRIPNRYFQKYISDIFMGVYVRYFANLIGPEVITLDFWNLDSRIATIKSFLDVVPEFNFPEDHG